MKRNLLLCLLLSCFICVTANAQTTSIGVEDALLNVQQSFNGKDVDYYLVQNSNSTVWTIFVDAEPMAGWEHDCYIFTVPKNNVAGQPIISSQTKYSLPPDDDMTPLSVASRYNDIAWATDKPIVVKEHLSNDEQTVAERTYAVILSGGVNKNSNYERYWNDCSFIYQSLVNKYGVPKSNISVIMSDGTDPADDMRTYPYKQYTYKSSPLDLDGDGTDDIQYSATRANIYSVLTQLSSTLEKDDHLFFFVIDHGGSNDGESSSYINLWGNEKLQDYELAEWLTPFSDNFVNINVVLGQCYSGGFIDDLTKVGCVVATASSGSELSWACSDIQYDEFVYRWTCAVTEADSFGTAITSDTDNNGRVTMDEAFAYAKLNDRRSEHPQYISTPISVGEDLAFNHLVPSIDLYIKDNDEDTGKEPNNTTENFWDSPSICVRNQKDGTFTHENPYYSEDHPLAYIYVRVHNRGKELYTGGKYVIVYWGEASTVLTTEVWKGRELYNGQYVTGNPIEPYHIGSIFPGDYIDIPVRWSLPNIMEAYPEGNFHFCLLAKIMDTHYDDGYTEGKTYFDLQGSNDQAQKNVIIVRKEDILKGFNVFVRNGSSTAQSYTLELVPRTANDASFYSKASVEMEMSPKIYEAWEEGGCESEDIQMVASSSNDASTQKVKFISTQSKLKNIYLSEKEFDIVTLKFNFFLYDTQSTTYTFDLIQKDENGKIIGGETFIVESPILSSLEPVEITTTPIGDGLVTLEIEDSEFTAFKWTDESGTEVGNTESVTVAPTANNSNYTVVATNEDGEIASGSVSLESFYGIKSVIYSSASNSILVNFQSDAPANATISVVSISEGTVKVSTNVPTGSNTISLDVSNLTGGLYTVIYYVNAKIIDQKKININN